MKNPNAIKYATSAYSSLAQQALPAMNDAEKHGARCSEHFVVFLNAAKQAAPNGVTWNDDSYRKARRWLSQLALITPPLDYQSARDNRIGHDERRVLLKQKLAKAGEDYRLHKLKSGKVSPFVE